LETVALSSWRARSLGSDGHCADGGRDETIDDLDDSIDDYQSIILVRKIQISRDGALTESVPGLAFFSHRGLSPGENSSPDRLGQVALSVRQVGVTPATAPPAGPRGCRRARARRPRAAGPWDRSPAADRRAATRAPARSLARAGRAGSACGRPRPGRR